MSFVLYHTNGLQIPIKKIGIFDSGLGGLTILNELLALPIEECIYIADTAHIPYGNKTAEELEAICVPLIQFLMQHTIDLLVIACHTASAVLLPIISQKFPDLPCIDMISISVQHVVTVSHNKRIGIMATQASIHSHAHKRALLRINTNFHVVEQACPLLVPLIEAYPRDHKSLETVLQAYLLPLRQEYVDTIMLGCTHYALIRNHIESIAGPSITIISSDQYMKQLFTYDFVSQIHAPRISLYVTGDSVEFERNAMQVLAKTPSIIKKMTLK